MQCDINDMKKVKEKNALKCAIAIVGTQAKLAKSIGVSQQCMSYALRRRDKVPADWCKKIERATGGTITRAQLRPDLFTGK